jgi:hypothetical protein
MDGLLRTCGGMFLIAVVALGIALVKKMRERP